MANFDKIFEDIIMIEGGYSNHPDDRGGETRYGITVAVARENGYTGSMRELPLETAKRIYEKKYFEKYNFQLIQNTKIAGELFEFTVNTGRGKLASKFLQRAYNLLNKNIFLTEDGEIGNNTAKTVNEYKYYKSLFKVMNIFQGMFYIHLAEADMVSIEKLENHKGTHGSEKHKTFIRGWIDNRVAL